VAAVYCAFAAVMTPVLGYVIPEVPAVASPDEHRVRRQLQDRAASGDARVPGPVSWMQSLANRYEFARIALARQEAAGGVIPAAVVLRTRAARGRACAGDREEVTL
jgi:hypothetical protein